MYPGTPDFEDRLDVRVLMVLTSLFGRSWQRREVPPGHACTVPLSGPAVIAANHTAGLDPIAIQSTCPRPIIWVMTAEHFDNPALRGFLTHVEMIRIDRTKRDAGAWRQALGALDRGHVVGVFPEGRIERTDDLMPFEDGLATMASRADVDIYPAYLDGRQRNTPMLSTYLMPQTPLVAWDGVVRVRDERGKRRKPRQITSDVVRAVESLKSKLEARRRKGKSLLS
ncbi:MAG: lysophospholipid acyltransferase family protein [Planctomycetota bacterium]